MEKTRYWMLTRRKLGEMPFLGAQIPALAVSSSYDESWEELAFARDSAGHIGGCIWPPRSYSCSFCRREFRSAQALGGHMNVHRKDRAMLKQSSSPSEETLESSHHHLASCTPTGTAHPSPIASLEHSTAVNPNPNSSFSASSISPGVSAASRQERNEQNSTYPFYSSSIVPKNLKGSLFSTARTLKESVTLQLFTVPELNLNKIDSFDQTGRDKLGLGEVNFRRRQDGDEKDEQNMCSKRRRTDSVPAFFVKPSSGERQLPQSEVLKHDTGPVEELDLELRLGDTPQVK